MGNFTTVKSEIILQRKLNYWASVNPSVSIPHTPPLGHLILSGICNLVGLAVGGLSENLCPGVRVRHLSILLEEAINIVPFSIFHLKNMPVYIAIDISTKNIFSTYTLKRFLWFLPHWPPCPTVFFATL